MFKTILSFAERENLVIFGTNPITLEWFVAIRIGDTEKIVRCLSCEQGIAVFDRCVEELGKEIFKTDFGAMMIRPEPEKC